MRAPLTLLAAGALLAGWLTNPACRPHDDSTAARAPVPEERVPDDATAEAVADTGVFGRVRSARRPETVRLLADYCQERGIGTLAANHVRLFEQPMGVVDRAIEIDLLSGSLTVYPGTHSVDAPVEVVVGSTRIANLRRLVTSEGFSQLPHESARMGLDGTSYLLEVSVDSDYYWALHWLPEDARLVAVIDEIQALAGR